MTTVIGFSVQCSRWASRASSVEIAKPMTIAIAVSFTCSPSAGTKRSDQFSRNQSTQNVALSLTHVSAAPPPPKSGMTGPAAARAAAITPRPRLRGPVPVRH